jgi:glycosyltransferase involved in cell wall biosynthesis
MKILHVVFSLTPGAYWGGISKLVYELAMAQASLGHDVTIYTTDLVEGKRVDCETRDLAQGCRIVYFRGRLFPRFSSPDMRMAMSANKRSFDVVHSHNNFLSFNVYVREVFGTTVPIFYQAHGSLDPIVLNKGILKKLKKRIYIRLVESRNIRKAAGMFVSTDVERAQLDALGILCPLHVMGNGINVVAKNFNKGLEFRRNYNIKHEKLIVYVGRIHWKKGIERLLRAFALVSRSDESLGLVVGGGIDQHGEYGSAMQSLAEQLGISGRVYWPGFVDEQLKVGIFSSAAVFSHVSESEGMAMAVLEAMSAGLPTIVGTGCYMTGAAESGAVVEIEPTAEALVEALQTLISDSSLADATGQKAKEYVARNHSWTDIAKRSVEVYSRTEIKP